MAHQFEECMVSCQDGRLAEIHFELIKKRGMGKIDPISWGNPILDLVEPENPPDKDFTLKKLEISIIHHQVKIVRLYNHFDCGYYKLRGFKFATKEEERERLVSDLQKAAQIIKNKFSNAEFKIYLYLLNQGDGGAWCEEAIK